jgi:hypothetical protein
MASAGSTLLTALSDSRRVASRVRGPNLGRSLHPTRFSHGLSRQRAKFCRPSRGFRAAIAIRRSFTEPASQHKPVAQTARRGESAALLFDIAG